MSLEEQKILTIYQSSTLVSCRVCVAPCFVFYVVCCGTLIVCLQFPVTPLVSPNLLLLSIVKDSLSLPLSKCDSMKSYVHGTWEIQCLTSVGCKRLSSVSIDVSLEFAYAGFYKVAYCHIYWYLNLFWLEAVNMRYCVTIHYDKLMIMYKSIKYYIRQDFLCGSMCTKMIKSSLSLLHYRKDTNYLWPEIKTF